MTPLRVWVGYDPREHAAWEVCRASIYRHASVPVDVQPLVLDELRAAGLYTRPTEVRDGGQLWDVISRAPMSTEFSLSRFLVPYLAGYRGWALFCDCDFLFRCDVAELFSAGDDACAVHVVKHNHQPRETAKMDGRMQTRYARKNWSSLMLWNCAHVGAQFLTPHRANNMRGADLHGLEWLMPSEIGALAGDWNYLVLRDPSAVHFTEGTPDMPTHEAQPFADEWRSYLSDATNAPITSSANAAVADAAGQK